MLLIKRSILLRAALFSLLFAAAYPGVVWADAIMPSQEQEFVDARGALEAARKAEGDKFTPSYMNQAEDFLKTASSARSVPNTEAFSRASRLARGYAELAKAAAELKANLEMLATTREALQNAKAEIDRLKN